MKRWSLLLPLIYFSLLFLMVFAFDFPREVTRQWMWIQVGGIVLMVVLGEYIEGSVPKRDITTIGLFTILWLALAFFIPLKKDYFVLLGLIIELILAFILKRGGDHVQAKGHTCPHRELGERELFKPAHPRRTGGSTMRRRHIVALILISTVVPWYYYQTGHNSDFNSLIASHPHTLGGIFTGNSTYYEYYQVNASDGTHYYQVARSENGRVLKVQEITYSDYLVYTGKALDMAQSLVEKTGKLPPGATLITYNVTDLTVRLYYSVESDGKITTENNSNVATSNITSTLPSPGKEFAVATVNLTSGNVSVMIVTLEELPRWVQNVVSELRKLKG